MEVKGTTVSQTMDMPQLRQMLQKPFDSEIMRKHCQPMRSKKLSKNGKYEMYVRMSPEFFAQLKEQWTADKSLLDKSLKELGHVKNYMRDVCKMTDPDFRRLCAEGFDTVAPKVEMKK